MGAGRIFGIVAVLVVVFCIGCSKDDDDNENNYKTVKIGNQTWMAENLNKATSNSKCYDNSPDSCAKYGRLYTWNDAKTVCPTGWHLPSDEEWTQLTDFVGGESTAGTKLKSSTGWRIDTETIHGTPTKPIYGTPVGTNEYGFSALPGGYGNSDGSFEGAGNGSVWWSATESSANLAYDRDMAYRYEKVIRWSDNKMSLFYVRCVRD